MGNWWQSTLPSVLRHFACWFSLGLHCWSCSRDATSENIAALASSDELSMIYHLTLRLHAHIRSLPFFLIVHQSVLRSADLLGFPWFWQALKSILCAWLSQLSRPSIASKSITHEEKAQQRWPGGCVSANFKGVNDRSFCWPVYLRVCLRPCVSAASGYLWTLVFLMDRSDFFTLHFLRPCRTPSDRLVVKVTLL